MIQNIETGHAQCGTYVTEVLQQHVLWSGDAAGAGRDMPQKLMKELNKEEELLDQSQLLTGKALVEMDLKQLDEQWRQAYVQPIVKGFQVCVQHDAICGVPEGQWVDPHQILPSRFILTNKGGATLPEAELKARWVLGGHRDPDAEQYQISSLTVSLVGYNLLHFVAVQMGWDVAYEDVPAAFLQGQQLPSEREIFYVRIPQGYPPEAMAELQRLIGSNVRMDLVRLLKGRRLWFNDS